MRRAATISIAVLLDVANQPSTAFERDITTTTYTAPNLSPLTTYYWRVVAKGDPFCTPPSSSKSEIRSFTTTGTCGTPGSFIGNQ